jgi:hypothetical protein
LVLLLFLNLRATNAFSSDKDKEFLFSAVEVLKPPGETYWCVLGCIFLHWERGHKYSDHSSFFLSGPLVFEHNLFSASHGVRGQQAQIALQDRQIAHCAAQCAQHRTAPIVTDAAAVLKRSQQHPRRLCPPPRRWIITGIFVVWKACSFQTYATMVGLTTPPSRIDKILP